MNIFSYVSRQYWRFRVRLASGTLSRLDLSMKKAGMTRTELLGALEKAVNILESEPDAYGIYKAHREQFRAAIRKAKGE